MKDLGIKITALENEIYKYNIVNVTQPVKLDDFTRYKSQIFKSASYYAFINNSIKLEGICNDKEDGALTGLKLTKQSFVDLQTNGVSNTIIQELSILENIRYKDETAFLEAVKKVIGEQDISTYKNQILNCAEGDLVWTEKRISTNVEKNIGTKNIIFIEDLTEGIYEIILEATDIDNLSNSDKVTIEVLKLEHDPPKVTISEPNPGAEFIKGTSITIKGSAIDEKNTPITGNKLKWLIDGTSRGNGGDTLTVNDLDLGNHTITLQATDQFGTVGSKSIVIVITKNKKPIVKILNPQSPNLTFKEGTLITFKGEVIDEDLNILREKIHWNSDKDGSLGYGKEVTKILSIGEHKITFTATDSYGESSFVSITVTVLSQLKHVVTIDTPKNEDIFKTGQTVNFSGMATCSNGYIQSYQWNFGDGSTAVNEPSTYHQYQSPGTYNVTFKVTDTMDDSTSVVIKIIIIDTDNEAPIVNILSPQNNAKFAQGEKIMFIGSATDKEDGILEGEALVWSSNIDGIIGNGISFLKNTLSPGEHIITLSATDKSKTTSTNTQIVKIIIDPACLNMADDLRMCVKYGTEGYEIVMRRTDPNAYSWKLDLNSIVTTTSINRCFQLYDDWHIAIPCGQFGTSTYGFNFLLIDDQNWIWQIDSPQ
ncbi:MAG: PKD domain-containing protein [Desulfobacterales bacterium]|nr:PKD domain-containing protein [Desulfobacterales bacterium]